MSVFLDKEYYNLLSDDSKFALEQSILIAEKLGINIYLIGGIVRDFIMNNKIKDIDVAVQGDVVLFAKELVEQTNCEIINIQDKLRTAKVKFESGVEIDFASTRKEIYLSSGILPQACDFGCDLIDDVRRRDFTLNTLALKLTGSDKFLLIDYFNGYQDIVNKKIRILHEKSFVDDPSRIIRAIKFKIRFNFDIEENTYVQMQQYLNNVDKKMPLERIKSELRQLFSIDNYNTYNEIIKSNAYKLISDNPIREINIDRINEILSYDLYDKSEFWFILICCLIINSDFAYSRLNMTAFERKVLFETKELLSVHEISINDNEKIYKLFNNKIDLSIALYYIISGEKSVIKFLNVLKQIKVLITGKDLIELGFIPSAYFNELFDKILKEKLRGKLKTKEEEKKFIQKFLKK